MSFMLAVLDSEQYLGLCSLLESLSEDSVDPVCSVCAWSNLLNFDQGFIRGGAMKGNRPLDILCPPPPPWKAGLRGFIINWLY